MIPVKLTLCRTREEFDVAPKGSIFLWAYQRKVDEGGNSGHILIKCPGCGDESAMHVRNVGVPHPANDQSWEISGIPDSVTMHPSIHHNNKECGWHGWLKNGEFA